ncbi:DUF6225 family protein [Nocardia wallacei]|uniref:DUF6225 family protein n=1 Tax=Nocardia wallacei TaxID=480035 RepID=UPI002456903E|nr:DUF6225 family protein [Nocardia wallacei]
MTAALVWTVKQVRDALATFPDDLPLAVCVPVEDATYETFAVTAGPAYQMADWGDGRGMVADERYVELTAFAYCLALRDTFKVFDEAAGSGS